jgi:hypothetical protein
VEWGEKKRNTGTEGRRMRVEAAVERRKWLGGEATQVRRDQIRGETAERRREHLIRRCGIRIRRDQERTNDPIRKEEIVEEERLQYRSFKIKWAGSTAEKKGRAAEGRREGCRGKEGGLQREGGISAEGRREGCREKKGEMQREEGSEIDNLRRGVAEGT